MKIEELHKTLESACIIAVEITKSLQKEIKDLKAKNLDSLKEKDEIKDKIEYWIAEVSLIDNGKLFWTETKDDDRSHITYGDLRKLIKLLED